MSGMKFFLDTNTCIYIINQNPPHVADLFQRYQVGELGLSSVTVAELAFGAAKSTRSGTRDALQEFLLDIISIPFDDAAAWVYGDVRVKLQAAGTPIGPLDMQIAAHAISAGVTLVTNNTKEFQRVPGLNIVNWFPEAAL